MKNLSSAPVLGYDMKSPNRWMPFSGKQKEGRERGVHLLFACMLGKALEWRDFLKYSSTKVVGLTFGSRNQVFFSLLMYFFLLHPYFFLFFSVGQRALSSLLELLTKGEQPALQANIKPPPVWSRCEPESVPAVWVAKGPLTKFLI